MCSRHLRQQVLCLSLLLSAYLGYFLAGEIKTAPVLAVDFIHATLICPFLSFPISHLFCKSLDVKDLFSSNVFASHL